LVKIISTFTRQPTHADVNCVQLIFIVFLYRFDTSNELEYIKETSKIWFIR